MHLFFDLDGTLTDPSAGISACIRYALTALASPIPTAAALTEWIGPPLQDSFYGLLQDDERATRAVALYRERFATVGLFENEVYPDIPAVLATLAEDNTLWVTTSKPQVFAAKIIHHFQLEPLFAGVYGSELDGTRANKADLLAHVLHAEAIAPETAIMIGDRRHDIVGAQHNRIPSVGVLWGFGSETELQSAGARQLCATPNNLPTAIQAMCPSPKG